MALQPGTKVGPYTIDSALGSGGMGEVYKAEDTRLHRIVAVKTLSQRLESNPQAIERFEREARAAASLNHPNICTIYDVGTDPPFIAMELLEGETLQQRLARGRVDPLTAVDIALALVDGLEAAHLKGVLHRDIKPANIYLTPRGPKILDFGLAKAVPLAAVVSAPDGVTRAPESLLTDEGTAIGTVAYMSPEQLRGKPLDARSDLFSLGLVLYEMVTGRPAFTGETTAVIAAAILQESPVLPRHIREDVPPRLEEVILKTIEKDPRDRTQSAAELRADLRRLKRELESGSVAARESTADRATSRSSSGVERGRSGGRAIDSPPTRWAVWTSLALLVIAGGAGYMFWARDSTRTQPNLLLQNLQVSQVTVTGNAWRPALSPDGKYVVYVRRDGVGRSLRLRQLGTERDVELAASAGIADRIQAATVTPDGTYVDFVRGNGEETTLWRIPFLGGTPKRILDGVSSPIGWSPDGQRFAFVRAGLGKTSTVHIANADGSNERTLATRTMPAQFLSLASRTTPSAQGAAIHPAWSPDGSTLALVGFDSRDGALMRQAIFIDVATGNERAIQLREESTTDALEWLDAGHLVLTMEGRNDAVSQLWVLSYPSGGWSRLTNDLSNYASLGVSGDRQSLAVAKWDHRVSILALDGSSSDPVDLVTPGPFVGTDFSWAGDRLLYALLSPVDNVPAIWAVRPGESSAQELVSNAYAPAASRDGGTIVFSRVVDGRRGMWRVDREGRNAKEIATSVANPEITSDGKQVIYLSNDSGVQAAWRVSADGGTPQQLANVYALWPTPSPDNTSVAFVTVNDRKQQVIAICALNDCSSRRFVPVASRPDALQWMPDGRGVTYSIGSNIWAQRLDGSAPTQLTRFKEDESRIQDLSWSADGKRLAFSRSITAWDIVLFRGVKTN